MLRWLTDENFDNDILRALFRRKPDIDLARAQDVGLMQGAPGIERMVWRETMTIQIPDDLARGLEGIAAAQRKSVEQVALESLLSLFESASSPEVVLRAVRQLPHPSAAAVDDLDAAIAATRLPVRDQGAFDTWPSV